MAGVVVFSGIALSACDDGGDTPDQPDQPVASIIVEPADLTLMIVDGRAVTAEYTATAWYRDGTTSDVTGDVTFGLDDSRMGTFAGATLTTRDIGGRAEVRATLGDDAYGIADLTIKLQASHVDPRAADLPPDPGGLFGGGDAPELAPSLVYPASGVLLPPNLRQFEIHWVPAPGSEVFAVSFTSPLIDVVVYTTCAFPLNGGCIYVPDAEVWRSVAESSRGNGPVAVRADATDLAGSRVGHGEPIEIGFSFSDMRGALYYWTTSAPEDGTATAIMRFDFGSEDQVAGERVVGTEMTEGHCVGCHALSPGGGTLLTSSEGSDGAMVLLLDLSTGDPIVPYDSTPPSAFSSWSPDNKQYVGVYANEQSAGWLSYDLNIFDGATGEFVATIDVGGTENQPANHPDWSPDGNRIVYTQVGQAVNFDPGTIAPAEQGSLRMVERSSADDPFGPPVELTIGIQGESSYYPSFSPGGYNIAFNRSVCTDGENGGDCDAYDDPGATLFITGPQAGATPVRLDRANAPGPTDEGRTVVENSFPRWAPFFYLKQAAGFGPLYWISFSSDRNYGLHTPAPGATLLWMAAIYDPYTSVGSGDPSSTAFALPFQDLANDNHMAQWTSGVATPRSR